MSNHVVYMSVLHKSRAWYQCRGSILNWLSHRMPPFVSKDHRNSDLNVDSTRVTEENEIHDFISDLRTQRLQNARNILLGHVNINSIRNKFEPIEGILRNGLIDILVISESKIDDSFPMAQFSVQNYTLHRKDRNSKGGGLMIYIFGPTYRIGGVQTSRTKGSLMKVQRWWFVNYICTKMKNGFYVHVVNLHELRRKCSSIP